MACSVPTARGSLVVLESSFNDSHWHAILDAKEPTGTRWAINAKAMDNLYYGKPRVWDCHAGKEYPDDAVYVGCRVLGGSKVLREGTIFGNGANPLVSHEGSLKTEAEFRAYAVKKMDDP